MPAWTDLFLRDSLSDDGTIPSPPYPYWSPDIICTQQTTYSDPVGQFGSSASYARADLCQPVISRQNNYFYVRARNMDAVPQGGRLYLYWSQTSLVMLPSQWINNAMYVMLPGGQQQYYAELPSAAAQAVTVTPTPLIWGAANASSSYCAVAVCSTAGHPWNPSAPPIIRSWDDFVMWVRNNQNVCWRNLQLVTNPNIPEWDSTAAVSNQFTSPVPLLVAASCENVPAGTTVSLRCSALPGFDTSQQVTNPNMTIYANGVTCPAGFSGYVETSAQTPGGSAWPSNARITTHAWVGSSNLSHPAAQFDGDFGKFSLERDHPTVAATYDLVGQGSLLLVGCNSMMVSPSVGGEPAEA